MEDIVVITGAGVSVESGIQPFRGKSGIWEENPMEMATYHKFSTDPGHFLEWYYNRFASCKDALPNAAHEILATKNIKVITQNIDNLHIKANHPVESLVEIHGNINYKRTINAEDLEELVLADWLSVSEESLKKDLLDKNIHKIRFYLFVDVITEDDTMSKRYNGKVVYKFRYMVHY